MIAFPDEHANGSWSPFPKQNVASVPSDIRFERLCRSIHNGYKAWECFRTQNRNFVEAYLGPGYGSTRDKRRKYINKSHQATVAYMMLLAANRPRVDIATDHESLQPFATTFAAAINHLLGEIHFEETLRRWVLDAYFQIGIVKVHRRDSGLVEMEPNLWMDPGNPFASNVSLDDFACDVRARNWGEVKWAGDMYRIPGRDIEEGIKSGMYDPLAAQCCKPNSKYESNDGDRLEKFGRGDECDIDEFEPMVDLADVWVASEQRIYTFPVLDRQRFHLKPTPIAVMDWRDPDHSPYHILGFHEAPESVMPVSPASVIDELDRLINNIMRKQARRAMNQKQGYVVDVAGAETGKRMKDAVDEEIIFGNPDSVKPYATSGINPQSQGFLNECVMHLDEQAGNLKAISGTGPQADTATQEELIHAAGNRIIGKMQSSVVEGTRSLVESLGLELWGDEFKTIVARLPVEGASKYTYDASWRPGDREGNFLDYNFDINVYSMNWQPPAAQLQEFLSLLTGVYLPMEQLIAAQGGQINMALVSQEIAKMSNKPWINQLVTFGNPIPEQPIATSTRGKKPDNTTRHYVRTSNSSGGTPQGQQQARTMAWLGAANAQQAGMANMGTMQQ